jgi:hypothetical protein
VVDNGVIRRLVPEVAPKFAATEEPPVHHIDALLRRKGRAELDDDYTSGVPTEDRYLVDDAALAALGRNVLLELYGRQSHN